MRPLEVDAFARGIRSDENFDGWIVLKGVPGSGALIYGRGSNATIRSGLERFDPVDSGRQQKSETRPLMRYDSVGKGI